MVMAINLELKETIRRELPDLLREDPALRDYIIELTRNRYADRQLTDERFNQLLQELRDERLTREVERKELFRKWDKQNEEDRLKWEEQNRKWEEQNRKWDEQKKEDRLKWEEQNHKWDEQKKEDRLKWEEQNRKWDEQKKEDQIKWEEQRLKWQEQDRKFREVHEEIMAQAKRIDRSIGALGARWGMQSERAFRNALAGILEETFGVQVINVNEYDDKGEVFGRPEQVELDVIIKNGVLLICELKSSIDKAGMYSFERKARFYEKRHARKANRLIVISPMIDDKARKVGEKLGIEMYSDSLDVKT
jgi:hypothetical protein